MHKSCESKGSTVHTIRPTTDYSVLHRCTSEDELVFEADVCYTYTTQNITAISSSASDSKGLSSGQIIGICVCVVSGIVVSVVVMGLVSGKSCFNAPTDREETTPLTGNNTSRTSRSVPAEGHRDSSTTYSSNSDTRNAVHRQQAEDESSNEDVADNSQANAASISERAEGDRDRSATHSSDSDDSNISSDYVRRQAEDDFHQSPRESNGEESGLNLSDGSQNNKLMVLSFSRRGELQSSQDQGGHNNNA